MNLRTQTVRRPLCREDGANASSTPLYQTATFGIDESPSANSYDYSRSGNPTRKVLEEKIATLEGADHALAYSSGLAAIHGVLSLVPSGGKILAAADLYGGSFRILSRLKDQRGIEVCYVDVTDLEELQKHLDDSIDLLLVESPSNPLHRVCDIRALSYQCRDHACILVIDNSVMSPWLQKPIELGADIVLESATKFLNGHADVTAGVLACNDSGLADQLRYDHNAMGVALGPFDCWLVLRGLETLAVRIEAQQKSARFLAESLRNHSSIEEVYYIGLEENSGYVLHHSQAKGPGSVFSFRVKDEETARQIIRATTLFATTVSFGSTRSTISRPFTMSHASIPEDLAERHAPPSSLIRISVGLEDQNELWQNLVRALDDKPARTKRAFL
ncbi:MAG: cystathionine beta-lyase [Planctomycetota bacterium]|jgi:cystathionine beta-lyase